MVFQGNAIAATIHGTVYEWDTFKPLNNSVVEINSTPEQNIIATDSEYSFNLTPGTYTINASYLEGNRIVYIAQEKVVISGEGEYRHDLLLFPPSHEELLNQDNFEAPYLDYEETEPVSQGSHYSVLAPAFLVLIVLLLALMLAAYLLGKKHEKSTKNPFPESYQERYLLESESFTRDAIFSEETETDSIENTTDSAENIIETSELSSEQFAEKFEGISSTDKPRQQNKPTEEVQNISSPPFREKEPNKSSSEVKEHSKLNLPEDLKELLEMVRESGNRITQRELRKKSPYSESKVSLMLSDLEERGLIEKFKRGRGNIVRIPDVHISKQTKHESKKE
ncbi:MarR family transcriptional regulator [Methanosarcina sp.]|uniref:helix-turn-helix transcriptional regulator n=1 Tax=Methanosarcina sp. TaxID=2213 RepID=UPI00298980AD|nr:MarR family transcriptional regulator [Methanosarcina sp.]MDW5552199.1 MarR family transcriptional regulator [Methanosarcina sp.]MDW5553340.1 MarR family transcriptional regulator [Methanosarcina sp.]MDW5558197.1 MarR family transcriptional regulator [Methanosarcina sp.]